MYQNIASILPAGHIPLWHFALSPMHLPVGLLKVCSALLVGPAPFVSVPARGGERYIKYITKLSQKDV